ncbi:transcription repressor NadR [Gracilibacillus marinus]|jgi:uncharacterized protein|uniref:Transcription repressor NadR n=1 Tax=Gracilibacillus marinus TaxID=630535 RepID=A0ABV8VV19_9BACI
MVKKLIGEERRNAICKWLQDATKPITGGELATKANVSRQVIVQDITLLKAQNHPIIATSNGYLYMQTEQKTIERVIACKHKGNETKEELYILVDHGVTVKDVIIEHPIYGDLRASVMVSTRLEVDQFITNIEQKNAPYLLELTDGIHNHTIAADDTEKLDQACHVLNQRGFLTV